MFKRTGQRFGLLFRSEIGLLWDAFGAFGRKNQGPKGKPTEDLLDIFAR